MPEIREIRTERMRAFLALEPSREWRERLRILQKELQNEIPDKAIRWVDPRNIHITLRFFGWIGSRQIEEIATNLRSICDGIEAFNLSCGPVGCFPSVRKPRVIWVGVNSMGDGFARLHARIIEATRGFGEPPEDRPFIPHLTLARIKQHGSAKAHLLEKPRPAMIETAWSVNEVLLMRSHLSPNGAEYERLVAFRLGRP